MTTLSPTARVILGMVKLGRTSGYEIKQFVDRSTRFFWAASYGQIYPELSRLEARGLISGTESPTGGRQRRTYELTTAGEQALHSWLTSPDELLYELRDEGLLKMFFSESLDHDERLSVVRAMRTHHAGTLADFESMQPEAGGTDCGPGIALDYGISKCRWAIDWCDRIEAELTGAGALAGGGA